MPFKNHFNLNKKPKREEAKGGRIEEGETLYTEVTGHCRIARLRLLCKGCRRWLCCVVWVYKRVSFTWGGFLFLNWMADLTDANSATPLLPSLITFSLGYASSLQIQFWILVKKYYKKLFFFNFCCWLMFVMGMNSFWSDESDRWEIGFWLVLIINQNLEEPINWSCGKLIFVCVCVWIIDWK